MVVKLILSTDRDWDRKIIEWLSNVPRGYRATIIKKELYRAITREAKEDISQPTDKPAYIFGRDKKVNGIGQSIQKMVKKKRRKLEVVQHIPA